MKLTKENFADMAEKAIKTLETDKWGNIYLTTSKIRNLLSLISELYSDASRYRDKTLDQDMIGRVQYIKMRIAYEAGRERQVKGFVEKTNLLAIINEVGNSRDNLLLFCNYTEALVAYHKFHGGRDK